MTAQWLIQCLTVTKAQANKVTVVTVVTFLKQICKTFIGEDLLLLSVISLGFRLLLV